MEAKNARFSRVVTNKEGGSVAKKAIPTPFGHITSQIPVGDKVHSETRAENANTSLLLLMSMGFLGKIDIFKRVEASRL